MISEVMKEMISYFAKDVKYINHALQVYGFAKTIGELEQLGEENQQITEMAAILHDIGIPKALEKYGQGSGHVQEVEGPPIAKQLLSKVGVNEDMINRVCYLVGHHHTYDNITGIDYQILIEADFLVNVFGKDFKSDKLTEIFNTYFKTAAGREIYFSMYLA